MKNKSLEILSKYYGYQSFRNKQEDIINSIINKNDVLAIMPTGGGKSICYQIPSLILDGITIVISPLISLMKDQVDALKTMGIEATYINSSLSNEEFNNTLNGIYSDKFKLIYVAPERLESIEFINIIRDKDISQIAVDEAHCVSQWGHDFRVSYRKVSLFIDSLNKRPIITAFTATASNEVQNDIVKLLKLKSPHIYITGFDRENLSINIIKSSSKNKYLLEYIENHRDESGIIYAATRKEVEKIYEGLLKRNVSVSKYHAGLSQNDRNQNQEEFIKDNINIMVATNAFGMGIDKPNIRWVVHYNMPQSVENYYQEIGRAGRDGENSECVLLFSPGDIHTQKYLIDIGVENPERKLFQHKKLQQMVDLVYSNSCYRRYILSYFGDDLENDCKNCSSCLDEGEVVDKTLDAQKVISCIVRMKRSFGVNMIVDVLRGSKNKKVIDLNFNSLSTYGIMRDYSSEDLKTFINTLVSHGYLDLVENLGARGSFPTIKPNEVSMKIIKGEVKVEFKEVKVIKTVKNDNKLYEVLRLLRYNIAINSNVAPYMVFGDGTLKAMCEAYPTTKEEMLNISGVGEVKYERYGEYFIEEIKKYMVENSIEKKSEGKQESLNSAILDEEYFVVNTDEKLLDLLLNYREEEASKQRVLQSMVLSKNTLKEISGRYPMCEEELSDISGIGKIKVEKYGKNILDIVKLYIHENNIVPNWEYKKRLKVILDGESRKQNEISLDLLNQGHDIESISKDLEVSVSTLLGYVCDYLKEINKPIEFNINLKKYYMEEEKELILEKVNIHGDDKVSIIKKSLPDTIRYEAIRAVILTNILSQYNLED